MIPWRKSGREPRKAAPKDAKSVLVIKFGGLADFVQSLAAAKRIREYHVGARITLLTTEEHRGLAEKCPYFDVVDSEGRPTEPQAAAQLIARIRAAKYEMVYDLESSSRTNSYYHGMRPWPPLWSGAAPGCSHPFEEQAGIHVLERYAQQLEAAGLGRGDTLPPDLTWVRVALRDPPRLSPDYFGIRGRYVLLLPRGASQASKRRWPESKYVDLACRLVRNGVIPVVLGTPEEREVAAAIVRGEPKAKNLISRADIFQCSALAERAAFALGDDVDLMHVAAAAGAPCLVFLPSMSDPDRSAPRGRGGVIALTATVIADIPVEQVERQLRNCGIYREAATA